MDLFASNFLSCDDRVCSLIHLGALFFGKTGFFIYLNINIIQQNRHLVWHWKKKALSLFSSD